MLNISRIDDPYFIDADAYGFEASNYSRIRWGAVDPVLRQIET